MSKKKNEVPCWVAIPVFLIIAGVFALGILIAKADAEDNKIEKIINDARIKLDIQIAYDKAYFDGMNDTLANIEVPGTNEVSLEITDMLKSLKERHDADEE